MMSCERLWQSRNSYARLPLFFPFFPGAGMVGITGSCVMVMNSLSPSAQVLTSYSSSRPSELRYALMRFLNDARRCLRPRSVDFGMLISIASCGFKPLWSLSFAA
jgi:hypothetical protein